MTFVTCAFVNSDNPPTLEEKVHGYHVEEIDSKTLRLSGFKLVSYPHPEAPENAILQVLEKKFICEAKDGRGDPNFPLLYMLLQAQSGVTQHVSA
jgi:hypothetical protein